MYTSNINAADKKSKKKKLLIKTALCTFMYLNFGFGSIYVNRLIIKILRERLELTKISSMSVNTL